MQVFALSECRLQGQPDYWDFILCWILRGVRWLVTNVPISPPLWTTDVFLCLANGFLDFTKIYLHVLALQLLNMCQGTFFFLMSRGCSQLSYWALSLNKYKSLINIEIFRVMKNEDWENFFNFFEIVFVPRALFYLYDASKNDICILYNAFRIISKFMNLDHSTFKLR